MFARYWLMKLVQNLQRRDAASVCLLVGQAGSKERAPLTDCEVVLFTPNLCFPRSL